MKIMTIGDVARETGLTVASIRYYEDEGVLPSPLRTANGRRTYEPAILERISFVQSCKNVGMSLAAIRQMLSLLQQEGLPCVEAQRIAADTLKSLSQKIAEMQKARLHLSRLMASCSLESCSSEESCSMYGGLSWHQ